MGKGRISARLFFFMAVVGLFFLGFGRFEATSAEIMREPVWYGWLQVAAALLGLIFFLNVLESREGLSIIRRDMIETKWVYVSIIAVCLVIKML